MEWRAEYWSHKELLTRIAARRVGEPDAEDMVQEAYVGLLEYPGEVPADEVLPFLIRLVIRRGIDFKYRGRQPQTCDLSNRSDAGLGVSSPVAEGLMSLPEIQRRVVECCELDRMTQAECAEYLNLSEQQVQRLRAKGLTELSLLLASRE